MRRDQWSNVSNVAVVLARGGSKRIPKKNLKDFCGRPMVTYPLREALACSSIDKVFLSSDDQSILDIAESVGATPILRPSSLSLDEAPTIPAMRHAITEIIKQHQHLSAVCCIYGTNPFVTAGELTTGYKVLMDTKKKFVFSAVRFAYPIERSFTIGVAGAISMLHPEAYESRTQEFDPVYHDADLFYWGSREAWMEEERVFCEDAHAVVYPVNAAFPIDNLDDWLLAEALFRGRSASAVNTTP